MSTIVIPEILLPKEGTDMSRWAVNACDQFTSDAEYWHKLENYVGGAPSALNLVYPEIYLKDDTEGRIERINSTMHSYLEGGIFTPLTGGFVLVERRTRSGVRTGIVLAVDLEDYSFEKGATSLIRSTEATILERIPPRVRIRESAPIELPHVMLLYDDPTNSVLGCVKRGKKLYDFDLNMDGGHVTGTYIDNAEEVRETLCRLTDGDRYGNGQKLMFAVGDGNHSLATAKTCWEELKPTIADEDWATHPARYALVEVVNLYDPALIFEPIHRFVKTDRVEKFIKGLKTSGDGCAYIVSGGKRTAIAFNSDVPEGIRQLDAYIAEFIAECGGETDYIHGDDQLDRLSASGVGISLPPIKKDDFFRLIVTGGNLPRKTFSMGEGNEKRYYIEAKKIVKG